MNNNTPYIIMCYSYKGGAGRTTASINIAASLFKLGFSTCLVDLDIESPGVHEIFSEIGPLREETTRSIQEYLRVKETSEGRILVQDPVSLEEFMSSGLVDCTSFMPEEFVREGHPSFYVVRASQNIMDWIPFSGDYVEQRLTNLFEKMGDIGIKFVIIDGASGLRNTSLLPMAKSDMILVFFRWSIQHVRGTLHAVRWIQEFKDTDMMSTEYLLIPSMIRFPHDSSYKYEILGYYHGSLSSFSESTGLSEEDIISNQIEWHPLLEWKEQIIVFEEEGTQYERLAQDLLERSRKVK